MTANLDSLLSIRTTVLALGQKGFGEWWSCFFLTPTGERTLAIPFPRSSYWAALHAATIAAARHHDERIGAGGGVHLFRLGPEMEWRLRDRVLLEGWHPEPALSDDRDALLASLREFSEMPAITPSDGPLRISDVKRFIGPKTLAQVSGHYVAAFESGRQILPYGSDK
ncbi:MAG TPA: BrxE family protein [Bacteroidia bacterium]|nr:BrxE family protein [Bacteroidia bacterium]